MKFRNYDEIIKNTPKDYHFKKKNNHLLSILNCNDYNNLSVSDTILIVLLHTKYLTNNHISLLSMCSPKSINTMLYRLKYKNYIKAFLVSNSISYKYYALTQKGYDYVVSILGGDYVNQNSISYKPTRRSHNKYIAHKLASLDVYTSLLSSAIIDKIEWENEVEVFESKDNKKSNILFRHDATINITINSKAHDQEVSRKNIWLEQDMSTESIAHLKTKFQRMCKKLKSNVGYTPYSILFTINVERHITKALLSDKYSKISNVKSLPLFNELLLYLKENKITLLSEARNGYANSSPTPKELAIVKLIDNLMADNITNINHLTILIEKTTDSVMSAKEKIVNDINQSKFNQRRNKIIDLLLSKDSQLKPFFLKGLDFYIISNSNIKNFTNKEYISPAPAYIRARRVLFQKLLKGNIENFKYIPKQKILDNKNIFYVRHYYEVVKNNKSASFGVEEYYNNVGAAARVHNIITGASINTAIILLVIVNDVKEAIKITADTKSYRFIKPNGGIIGKFAVYFTNINQLYTGESLIYTINHNQEIIKY
ncbi:replication-relaxation family protein [Vallitalea guaymasensis]|uniref:replication-relaxation family protein n=1 Tax=Vallitalea guaymasensis TaxID=1185412 RepID=UPI000DE53DC1|nr:replication-relaxation family protein [Vallitalea guaymasensis]